MVIYYPTFFVREDASYIAYIPDLSAHTEGYGIEHAVAMAQDVIFLNVEERLRNGQEIPSPSNYNDAYQKAAEDKEIIDFTKGFLKNVEVNLDEFIEHYDFMEKEMDESRKNEEQKERLTHAEIFSKLRKKDVKSLFGIVPGDETVEDIKDERLKDK